MRAHTRASCVTTKKLYHTDTPQPASIPAPFDGGYPCCVWWQSVGVWIYEASRGQDRTPVFKRRPPSTLITEASFNGACEPVQIQVGGSWYLVAGRPMRGQRHV